ncbi:hypothetical protein ACWD33_19665 [Streptomyces xiamenensis]|uniref:Histone protein n=1 Tax=Streptomyces xiamenensis TaxID=408015 RepID=A0A0F7G102_9ACTN|nr:hypothetical protein [Streptomyces xiamenensis]AKG46347.1 histone protein [Streptomyces xiamenensis]
MDNSKAALAAGIAGGYVLGRTRKAKVAFAIATYVIGRRFPLTPRHLAEEGGRRLREHPRFGALSDQVRGDLLESGRSAVMAAATARIDALSEALRRGAQALEGVSAEQEQEQEPEQEEPEPERKPKPKAKSGAGSGPKAKPSSKPKPKAKAGTGKKAPDKKRSPSKSSRSRASEAS